jgi:hypothetical protein
MYIHSRGYVATQKNLNCIHSWYTCNVITCVLHAVTKSGHCSANLALVRLCGACQRCLNSHSWYDSSVLQQRVRQLLAALRFSCRICAWLILCQLVVYDWLLLSSTCNAKCDTDCTHRLTDEQLASQALLALSCASWHLACFAAGLYSVNLYQNTVRMLQYLAQVLRISTYTLYTCYCSTLAINYNSRNVLGVA